MPLRDTHVWVDSEQIEMKVGEATVHGRNGILRQGIASGDPVCMVVPKSTQQWRTRQDSNL